MSSIATDVLGADPDPRCAHCDASCPAHAAPPVESAAAIAEPLAPALPVSNSEPPLIDRAASLLHGSVTAWLVLLVSLLLTAAAWYYSNEYIERRIADRFRFRTAQVAEAVANRMHAYEQVLRGGTGLFAASSRVTRNEWRVYTEQIDIERYYPGIQGMGVSIPVAAADLQTHVAEVRAEGFPDYRIRPGTPRETYHTIVYLEPFDWRNQRAFGYDMYTNPVRRAAMSHAIDSGEPTISSMVTLVQETDSDVQKGFLFYLPLYVHGAEIDTPAQRRAAFTGFVYAAFRAADLMHGILGEGERDLHLEIFDGDRPTDDRLLYQSESLPTASAGKSRAGRSVVMPIELAGHHWTLKVRAKPSFAGVEQNLQSMVVACGGITVDVLLFLIINSISRQRRRALAAARAMTRDLRHSQRQLRAVSDAAYDAIVSAGPDRRIAYWNPSAERMFGYTAEQATGQPITMLFGGNSARLPEQVLALLTGGDLDAEHSPISELVAWHSDGRSSPVEVTLARWHADDGVHIALTLRDVTERRRLERERADYTAELERSNRELDEFAYVASHDLKAPLRAVDNLASWITDDAGTVLPPASRRHLELLRGRVRRMEGLLEDLLRYSRAGRVLGEESVVLVPELVDEVVGLLAPPPGLRIRCVSSAPEVLAYRTPLRQVLQNLLGNAIKHHDRDTGSIVVACELHEGRLEFTVCDDGPGIAPEFRERVFDMFETLRSRDELEGSGMGLSIVKKIVESQGGTVHIEAAEERGTRVRFWWPLRAAAAQPASPPALAAASA